MLCVCLRRMGTVAACCVALTAWLDVLSAAEPFAGSADSAAASTKSDSKQRGRRASRVDGDDLIDFADSLGYDFEESETTDGEPYVTLTFEKGDWTMKVTALVSSDGSNIWLTNVLDNVPQDENLERVFQKLLAANYTTTGGACFAIDEQNDLLILQQAIPNHGVDEDVFEEQVEKFLDVIVNTSDLWFFADDSSETGEE